MLFRLCLFIFFLTTAKTILHASEIIKFSPHAKWFKKLSNSRTYNTKQSIESLFYYLSQSSAGDKLLQVFYKKIKNKPLEKVLVPSDISLTDTTLTRVHDIKSGGTELIEESIIYLNQNLSMKDALLDLAHEMVHFNYKNTFNPYDSDYNVVTHIKNTIEGKGAEAHAFIVECQVSLELFGAKLTSKKCIDYFRPQNKVFDYKKVVSDFYKVGDFYDEFSDSLGPLKSHFHHIKNSRPIFISAHRKTPYPIAALTEFLHIKAKTCENEKRRMRYIASGTRDDVSFLKNCQNYSTSSVHMRK